MVVPLAVGTVVCVRMVMDVFVEMDKRKRITKDIDGTSTRHIRRTTKSPSDRGDCNLEERKPWFGTRGNCF